MVSCFVKALVIFGFKMKMFLRFHSFSDRFSFQRKYHFMSLVILVLVSSYLLKLLLSLSLQQCTS